MAAVLGSPLPVIMLHSQHTVLHGMFRDSGTYCDFQSEVAVEDAKKGARFCLDLVPATTYDRLNRRPP